ncbi:MAG: peptide ABC transporter permease, partial [Mailhella sp.]|nr:peptide ABC transporter permease [Mailhella sp.]
MKFDIRKHGMLAAGLLIVIVMSMLAIAAPLIAPFDPAELSLDELLSPPSSAHIFGTDALG